MFKILNNFLSAKQYIICVNESELCWSVWFCKPRPLSLCFYRALSLPSLYRWPDCGRALCTHFSPSHWSGRRCLYIKQRSEYAPKQNFNEQHGGPPMQHSSLAILAALYHGFEPKSLPTKELSCRQSDRSQHGSGFSYGEPPRHEQPESYMKKTQAARPG